MFAAIRRLPIGRDHTPDDIENRVGAVALTVNNRALLKSNNRRDDGKPSPFVSGEQLMHSSCRGSPRLNRPDGRPVTAH